MMTELSAFKISASIISTTYYVKVPKFNISCRLSRKVGAKKDLLRPLYVSYEILNSLPSTRAVCKRKN